MAGCGYRTPVTDTAELCVQRGCQQPAKGQLEPLQQRTRGRRSVQRSNGWRCCGGGEGLNAGPAALDARSQANVLVAGCRGVCMYGRSQKAGEDHSRRLCMICSGASALKLKNVGVRGKRGQQQKGGGGKSCRSHALPF
jgi:hypothetical protein